MVAAALVVLAGFGMVALGTISSPMYDIGIVVVVLGAVGIVVRLGDVWRRLTD